MNDKGHRMRYRRAFAEVDEKQAVIDALVAALEYTKELMHPYTPAEVRDKIDSALSLARKGG